MSDPSPTAPSAGPSTETLRVALFGSPDFALPTLEALHARHEVALVVTQPPKPAGRGMALRPPATMARAEALGLPVAHPAKLRGNDAFRERLAALDLDVAVTAAYGKILPADLLAVPRHGFLNVHASLLPAYRGAAPVQWALIDGRDETGVTIMQTDPGLDTGPIRLQRSVPIGPHDTAPELFERLAELGAEALLEALELLARGELPRRPQNDAAASHARLLTTEDGRLEFARPARESYDRYRGVAAWPGTWFEWGGDRIKVEAMRPVDPPSAAGPTNAHTDTHSDTHTDAPPGRVLAVGDDGVTVACGAGALRLERVKPAGRSAMAARDWANGYGVAAGMTLARTPAPSTEPETDTKGEATPHG